MKIIFKKILCLILISMITFITFIFTSCKDETPPLLPELRNYVALGDSDASGYGLLTLEERHTDILFERLKEEGYVDNYKNMAVSGYTTTMLLEFLNGIDEESLEFIQGARIITINIGGNNILFPFKDYLAVRLENMQLEDFLTIASTLFGSFSLELESEMQKSVETFSSEFNEIITWLDINAPRATVIVNTVYNPIPQKFKLIPGIVVLEIPIAISAVADGFIREINNTIFEENLQRENKYLISDTYSRFASEANIWDFMNIEISLSTLYDGLLAVLREQDLSYFDFIHPNAAGHNMIAELKYELFE